MEINWCFIIPLLVGLVCAILGFLLGRFSGKCPKIKAELDTLKLEHASLQADLRTCQSNLSAAKAEAAALTSAPIIAFDSASAKAAMGVAIKIDDLTVIEGIGPKIQELFHNFNIKTWKALSETSVERCQEVLDSGGPKFRVHTPQTWPDQALMAYEGRWTELKKWQDENDYGKEKAPD